MENTLEQNCHGQCENTQGRLGKPAKYSDEVGHEQNKLNQGNLAGQSYFEEGSSVTQQQRCRAIGGILRRLAEIEEKHLKFVDSHTDRLKKRLADDERERQETKQDIDELRTEILSLLNPENQQH